MNALLQNGLNKTKDYKQFKYLPENRNIIENHVKLLVNLITVSNDLHLNPMIVNSNMEVVDGQHRLEAAKRLDEEIYYLVDDNFSPDKIISLNMSQKKWSHDDFLKFWIENGRDDYKKLAAFKNDIGLKLTLVLKWLGGGNGKRYLRFKKGSFKFKLTEDIAKAILHTKKLITILKTKNIKPIKILTQGAFHESLRKFFTNPLIDIDRFFSQLEKVPFTINYSLTCDEYLEELVEIYNFDIRKSRLKLVSDGTRREIVM